MSYKSVIVFTGLGVCVSYGDYVIMPVNDKMKLVNGSVQDGMFTFEINMASVFYYVQMGIYLHFGVVEDHYQGYIHGLQVNPA